MLPIWGLCGAGSSGPVNDTLCVVPPVVVGAYSAAFVQVPTYNFNPSSLSSRDTQTAVASIE